MHTAIPLTVLATALACLLASAPANARARVFVASYGNDSNPCTFGSPCKTFQQALTTVDAGGEVTAIDSAGFGPMTITRAVTITSPDGVEAGIVPPTNGTAITINAGVSDAIFLRGLTIDGGGIGATGIQFNSGQSLTIDNCVIKSFVGQYPAGTALNFLPTTSTTLGVAQLSISNSILSNNASYGAVIKSGPEFINAVVSRVQLNNNQWGLAAIGIFGISTTFVTVHDSVVANNKDVGLYADDNTRVRIFHSAFTDNSYGIQALTGGLIWLAESMVTGSNVGYDIHPLGKVYTFGDNYIYITSGANYGLLDQSYTKQ
jgi:hypothetical protein